MLVDNCNYRLNRMGEIVKRQTVEVQCDVCGVVWHSLYANRKRKKSIEDYCKSCRSRRNMKGTDLNQYRWGKVHIPRQQKKCLCCEKLFTAYRSAGDQVFCGVQCKLQFQFDSQYGHLSSVFEQHLDYVSYLMGAILGDGYLRSSSKRTTQVLVACNAKQKCLISVLQKVLNVLQINWKIEKSHHNCRMVCFRLPNDLLQKYGMLFSGNKYSAQPTPVNEITQL